jgi:hypothetical protein
MKKLFLFLLIVLFVSCESNTYSDLLPKVEDSSATINLKWNKAYPEDSIDKSLIGLKWGLSYLGAKLPKNFGQY